MHPWLLVILLLVTSHDFGISNERSLSYLTNRKPRNCVRLPPPILSNILGPAYNSRYMSIDKPPVMDDEPTNGDGSGKRGASWGLYPDFYVDEDHLAELGNNPAWAVDHSTETVNTVLKFPRNKREAFNSLLNDMGSESRSTRSHRGRGQADGSSRPWECESKIRWVDLGPEYYPRFLRTVECAKARCWYGHYHCTPRSFTVKMLRRRTGECVPVDSLQHRVGVDGLPGELSELWVWEERAVNFCCDCAPNYG